jgi:Immunoglobulin I-set domain
MRISTNQARTRFLALLCLVALACAGIAQAQLPIPPSTQFDITGFLQSATLDAATPLAGGTVVVNGHVVTVPANTIVILPANALTYQELFAKAPPPYTNVATGMAMSDVPAPLTTYEWQVIGNRVGDTYIAGLIYVSQQGLNQGAGYINFIDYNLGEMRVGGLFGSNTTGTRVRLNDPIGRYGRQTTSPDVRFTVDPDNPTIMAGTGYPMCFPRTAPLGLGQTSDALCPEENRPITGVNPDGSIAYAASFTTNNLTNPNFPAFPGVFPDSTKQAPLEVGDFVTYSGTLVQDCATCPGGGSTAGPWPLAGTAATWISAHTIVNNTAIYTFQGSNPAYIETDVFILGTGGLTVLGVGEAAIRTRFEGMMTDVDPSQVNQRIVHLYGIDLDSAGNATDRDWGTIGVDPGPPLGAVKGRWRFRPPCLPFGTVPTKPQTQCVMNAAGTFLPAPREMRSVIEGLQSQNPANPGALTSANGLFYGQYHAPILEYIFPENIPGSPIVENNFNAMPFLACGGYSSSGIDIPPTAPVLAPGALNPWPSNVAPLATACTGLVTPPTAVVATATPSSVISGTGTVVTLSATASGTAPITFTWTQNPADVPQVVLTPSGNNATFVTPVVAANTTLNFTVTATNTAGSASAPVSVAVAFDQPVVNPIAFQSVLSGTRATINITGTDPGGLDLTFTVVQTCGPAPNVSPLVVNQNTPPNVPVNQGNFTFIHTLALGAPAVTLCFDVTATNTAGVSSVPQHTQVTVNPQPDSVAVTSAEYRTGIQRLIINATSSVISPNVTLKLQPYLTEANTTYNPDPAAGGVGNLFTNNGAGLYTITLVGVPRPACNLGGTYATPCAQRPIVVNSNLGGTSGPTALTRIRQ